MAMNKERVMYLRELADEYGVPENIVFALAEVLGPSEDRDGLVTELEDIKYMGFEF